MGGVVGERELEEGDPTQYRPQQVAFALAKRILDANFNTVDDKRPWLFPQLVEMCRRVDRRRRSSSTGGYSLGYLMTITEAQALAAEAVWNAIVRQVGNRRERLRPMINRFDPVGSTGDVDFQTRKAHRADGEVRGLPRHPRRQGRQHLGAAPRSELELNRNVKSYVKNDHLGFTIPYVHKGRSHSYMPDFLVRLEPGDDGDRAHPRSSRSPAARRAPGRPARRRPPRATRGASRSTTTAASAAGATSR